MKKEANLPWLAAVIIWIAGMGMAFLVITGNDHLMSSPDPKAGDPLLSLTMAGGAIAGYVMFFASRKGRGSSLIYFCGGLGFGALIAGMYLVYDPFKWIGLAAFVLCGIAKLMSLDAVEQIGNRKDNKKSIHAGRILQ